MYALVQTVSGDKQDILFGDLTNRKVGDLVARLEGVYGKEPWIIKRIYGPEEQKLIDALVFIAGSNGFTRVAELFRY
jgi:hypothetical protein